MLVSEAIVEILGAGLAPATREAIKGELDGYRRPHRSGRPVCDRELLPIAVTVTVAARFRRVNAEHLPTLVSLGGLLVAASLALFVAAAYSLEGYASWMTGHLIMIPVMGALIAACLRRRVPARSLAATSCLLGFSLLIQLVTREPATLAMTVLHVLLYVVAAVVPFLFVSLAWKCRHGGCTWSELPDVLSSDPLSSLASRVVPVVFLVAAVADVVQLMVYLTELTLLDRIGLVFQALGLALLWAGFQSVTARSAT